MISKYLPAFISTFLIIFTNSQPTNSDSCLLYNNTNGVCQDCLQGFYLDYFFCAPCAPLCSCSNRTNYCQQCMSITVKDGLIQIQTFKVSPTDRPDLQQCKLCSEALQNCIQCTSQWECSKCMNGKYLTKQNLCSNQTCSLNCQICKSQNECQRCQKGYYLIEKNDISLCSTSVCMENCIICESQSLCQLCSPFYFQQNGTCLECPINCTVCNDSQTCTVCMPGTYFINGTCQDVGVSNCILISGGFYNPTCLICEQGYYNAQGSCTQCQGCELCSTAFICYSKCLQGYERFNYACIKKLYQYKQVILFWILTLTLLIMIQF